VLKALIYFICKLLFLELALIVWILVRFAQLVILGNNFCGNGLMQNINSAAYFEVRMSCSAITVQIMNNFVRR
jgi:hypothetical protein